MRIVEPKPEPIRILFEEDKPALEALKILLELYSSSDLPGKIFQREFTKQAFLNMSKVIEDRLKAHTLDYTGEKYVIFARGRRRMSLGLNREPDLFIGSEYGSNFLDACHNFFWIHPNSSRYSHKRNTFYGRSLFGHKANDVYNYESGVHKTDLGYVPWFVLASQTYTLTEEKTRGDAVLRLKLLGQAIEKIKR